MDGHKRDLKVCLITRDPQVRRMLEVRTLRFYSQSKSR